MLRSFVTICLQMSAGGRGRLSLAVCTRAQTPLQDCVASSQVLVPAIAPAISAAHQSTLEAPFDANHRPKSK